MSIIVTLEHTVEEVDKILLALAERPFKEVSDLINKIRGQGMAQVRAAQSPPPGTEAAPAPQAVPEPAPASEAAGG